MRSHQTEKQRTDGGCQGLRMGGRSLRNLTVLNGYSFGFGDELWGRSLRNLTMFNGHSFSFGDEQSSGDGWW